MRVTVRSSSYYDQSLVHRLITIEFCFQMMPFEFLYDKQIQNYDDHKSKITICCANNAAYGTTI